jgi:hypothetical protein
VTCNALESRIRARCDSRTIRQSQSVLVDWINEAIAALENLLLDEDSVLRGTTTTGNIVSGTQTTAVPSDLLKLVGVQIKDTDGYWYWLESCPLQEIETRDTSTDRRGMRYTLYGDDLHFDKIPGWSEIDGVKFWYVPSHTNISGTGTYDGVNGWDEYVVAQVVVWVKEKAEKDITSAAALLGLAEKKVLRAARKRNRGQPDRIRITRGFGGMRDYRWRRGHFPRGP